MILKGPDSNPIQILVHKNLGLVFRQKLMSLFSFYKMNVLFGRKKLNILVPQISILFTGTYRYIYDSDNFYFLKSYGEQLFNKTHEDIFPCLPACV